MPGNLAYQVYQLIWEAVDWLYPPTCGGCGVAGTRWCTNCAQNTPEINTMLCPICGNTSQSGEVCQRCQSSRPFYTALRSYTIFNGSIKEAIHRFKYDHDMGLGEALSRLMITKIQKLNWSVDIITPVPLGLARLKERGYNQAALLARPIALSLKLPYLPKLLKRTRETPSQVDLSYNERQENMADAFKAQNESARGKTILVVDDVATSGATINACAKALLDIGVSKVYGFSLTRAVLLPEGSDFDNC